MSERKRGYVIVHQGHEDDYYEECSECHSKDASVDDNFCSNCGVMFFGIKNAPSQSNWDSIPKQLLDEIRHSRTNPQ